MSALMGPEIHHRCNNSSWKKITLLHYLYYNVFYQCILEKATTNSNYMKEQKNQKLLAYVHRAQPQPQK